MFAATCVGRRRLLLGRVRDRADQLGELARHLLDLAQRLAGLVGGLGSLDHALRAALHGRDRVLRVAPECVFTIAPICLVASPERSASRCTSSATTVKPRPASPAEAAWIAAFSASTLVCSVMSEISSHDLADLLRALAQALDALRGLLDLLADVVHAADRVLHRLRALLGGARASVCATLRRVARVLRHLVDRLRHLQHRAGRCPGSRSTASARRSSSSRRDRLRLLRRRRHLLRRVGDAAPPGVRSSSIV